jgi:hypothetical protein
VSATYEDQVQRVHHWRQTLASQLFVNCWVMAESESIAMWKVYASYDRGIVIQSTVQRFLQSIQIPEPRGTFRTGRVSYYADLPTAKFDFGKSTEASWKIACDIALEKRACFRFENEWRAILFRGISVKDRGIEVSATLNDLIEGVFVSPRAPRSFLRTVAAVGEKFALDVRPRRSKLADPPPNQSPVLAGFTAMPINRSRLDRALLKQ